MNIPQSVQDALASLEVAFLGAATAVVTALGFFGVQWIRQRTQSMAISTGMQLAGGVAYSRMIAASKDGHGYAVAEKMGLVAAQQAIADAGSPTVNAMGEGAVGAIAKAGLGDALKADPGVTVTTPPAPIMGANS